MIGWKRWRGGSGISSTICKSFAPSFRVQTDDHASTSPLSFYRPNALPAAQPSESKHWRHKHWRHNNRPISLKVIYYLLIIIIPNQHLASIQQVHTSKLCHKCKSMFHNNVFNMKKTSTWNKESYIHQISYKTFNNSFTTVLITWQRSINIKHISAVNIFRYSSISISNIMQYEISVYYLNGIVSLALTCL